MKVFLLKPKKEKTRPSGIPLGALFTGWMDISVAGGAVGCMHACVCRSTPIESLLLPAMRGMLSHLWSIQNPNSWLGLLSSLHLVPHILILFQVLQNPYRHLQSQVCTMSTATPFLITYHACVHAQTRFRMNKSTASSKSSILIINNTGCQTRCAK